MSNESVESRVVRSMGGPLEFFDPVTRESFVSGDYVVVHDKRGRRQAKTMYGGHAVFKYLKKAGG